MENKFLYKIKSTVFLHVEGKNIENFIKRLHQNGISLLSISYPSHKEVIIKVYLKDYETIQKLKTIYTITVLNYGGMYRAKTSLKRNRLFLFFLLLGIIFLYFLSTIIFKVEIIHNDSSMRKLLLEELERYNIKPYQFVKSFEEVEKIKEEITQKYRNQIEWLEIERIGVTYQVRVQERKLPEEKEVIENRHIVASKPAIIQSIEAESGTIVKNKNDYVKEGDIIISGEVTLNEEKKGLVAAKGKVYGEVWYQTTVEYPFVYQEEKETNHKKTVLSLHFLNHTISLDFSPFSHKRVEAIYLIQNPLLPLSLTLDHQKEIIFIDEINTREEAIAKALQKAEEKMEENLKEGEKILYKKILSVREENSKIVCEVFFTIYEDITSYQTITEELEDDATNHTIDF